MESRPINVFLLDDEFPLDDEFRRNGVYNSAISTEDLYHLAVNFDWGSLSDLQQLIKKIVTSEACKMGNINLVGFSTPTQALSEIAKGIMFPNVIIYDWEYLNAPIYSDNAKSWLLELLKNSNAFIFVYSKKSEDISRLLNGKEFMEFSNNFQLFHKGGKREASFSSEEFIHQYIISAASRSGEVSINDIPIQFTQNQYLETAADLLYLQRILGKEYVLDELKKINFFIDAASVEKILNDSEGFILYNEEKKVLFSPLENFDEEKIKPYIKLSYLDVVKQFKISKLEDTLERGFLFI